MKTKVDQQTRVLVSEFIGFGKKQGKTIQEMLYEAKDRLVGMEFKHDLKFAKLFNWEVRAKKKARKELDYLVQWIGLVRGMCDELEKRYKRQSNYRKNFSF